MSEKIPYNFILILFPHHTVEIKYLQGEYSLTNTATNLEMTIVQKDAGTEIYVDDVLQNDTERSCKLHFIFHFYEKKNNGKFLVVLSRTASIQLRPKTPNFGECKLDVSKINNRASNASMVAASLLILISSMMANIFINSN